MATPESIAAAFARGLMEGLLKDKPAKEQRPAVVPIDSVKQAVAEFLAPLIESDAPTGPQLDLFTADIENAEPDPMGEAIAMRVAEARARVEAQQRGNDIEDGYYDPNAPQASPWTSPKDE